MIYMIKTTSYTLSSAAWVGVTFNFPISFTSTNYVPFSAFNVNDGTAAFSYCCDKASEGGFKTISGVTIQLKNNSTKKSYVDTPAILVLGY